MADTHAFVEYTSELGKVLNNVRNYVPTTDITTDKKNNTGRIFVPEEEANARIVGMFDTRLVQDQETGKWYVEIYDSSELPYTSDVAGFVRLPNGEFYSVNKGSIEIDFNNYNVPVIYLQISWNNTYSFDYIFGTWGHNDTLATIIDDGNPVLPRTYTIPLAWWKREGNYGSYTASLHPLRMPGYLEVHDRWV